MAYRFATATMLLIAACLLGLTAHAQTVSDQKRRSDDVATQAADAGFAAAAAAAAAAEAADAAYAADGRLSRWLPVAESSTSKLHIDRKTIVFLGDRVRAWNRVTQLRGGVETEINGWLQMRTLKEYDCRMRTTQVLHIIATDKYGAGVDGSGARSGEVVPVGPETMDEHALDTVCSLREQR